MSLVEHAQRELKLAGLFSPDSDYEGEIGLAVMELIRVFAKQGHSGFSAYKTLQIFQVVAKQKNLMPVGITEDEWMKIDEGLWQNTRSGNIFSKDGGKTYYDIDKPKRGWLKELSYKLLRRK